MGVPGEEGSASLSLHRDNFPGTSNVALGTVGLWVADDRRSWDTKLHRIATIRGLGELVKLLIDECGRRALWQLGIEIAFSTNNLAAAFSFDRSSTKPSSVEESGGDSGDVSRLDRIDGGADNSEVFCAGRASALHISETACGILLRIANRRSESRGSKS